MSGLRRKHLQIFSERVAGQLASNMSLRSMPPWHHHQGGPVRLPQSIPFGETRLCILLLVKPAIVA